MQYTYIPKGVCSQKMIIEVDKNIIKSVKIVGGCAGNTVGVSRLVEGMNVDEAIKRLKGIPCGFKPTSCPDQLSKALEEVKLSYAIDRKLGLLSGGELQRVLLALALHPKPDLLLLDEPISGVDVNGQRLFYETVQELKKKYHMAIVLITHEIGQLENICDRALLLNKKILASGTPKEVKEEAIKQKQFVMGGNNNGKLI